MITTPWDLVMGLLVPALLWCLDSWGHRRGFRWSSRIKWKRFHTSKTLRRFNDEPTGRARAIVTDLTVLPTVGSHESPDEATFMELAYVYFVPAKVEGEPAVRYQGQQLMADGPSLAMVVGTALDVEYLHDEPEVSRLVVFPALPRRALLTGSY